jgi:hypothetical protein
LIATPEFLYNHFGQILARDRTMKELRCFCLGTPEVLAAIDFHRRRQLIEPLPGGIVDVSYEMMPEFKMRITHRLEKGASSYVTTLEHEEVLTSVVTWLIRRRIRLPAQSEKILYLIGGSLFIMITINFRKSLRTIVERTAEAA